METIDFKTNQTVVFDGDSLTALRRPPAMDQWPWLRISNAHRSWADVFSELLFAWRPELNLSFRTTAVAGSTCRDLKERFDSTVVAIKPDWVFITLGTNDTNGEIPLEEFEATLREYAERVGEWGGQVVFLYGLKPCPHASAKTEANAEKQQSYYAVEKKLSIECPNVHGVDVGSGLLEKAQILHKQYDLHNVYSDGVHYSNLGAIILAGEVLKACGVVLPTLGTG